MKLGNYAYFRISKTEQPLYKLMGTKGWSAPEIFDSSQKTFTFAMDLFSLGLVFAYVLSGGIHPFGKEKEDRIVKIKKKEPMTFTLKQLVNVDGAEKVFDLICSMLSFDPEERPTASAVFNDTFFSNQRVNEFFFTSPIGNKFIDFIVKCCLFLYLFMLCKNYRCAKNYCEKGAIE